MRILSPFYFKIIALLSMNLDLFRIIKQEAMKKTKPKLIVIFLIFAINTPLYEKVRVYIYDASKFIFYLKSIS